MATITYQSPFQGPVTIELGRRPGVTREGYCDDVCISRALAIDCPLVLTALVRTDGSVVEWAAEWGCSENTYWHLDRGSEDYAAEWRPEPRTLTAAQRETLIRIWAHGIRPFGVDGTCGATIMTWVAATLAELRQARGGPVYLTAPCDSRENILR